MISGKASAWLAEFLADCARSPRLNDFEEGFVGGLRSRFARLGSDITISDAQWPVLRRIEGKIHAAG
jgi:hypothetical protein